MEWKYAKERNAYILTLAQLGFAIVLISSMLVTDFFRMFG
ncbi:DUF4181 domain-containing protein [Lentibacillus sp. JNUCC-1]